MSPSGWQEFDPIADSLRTAMVRFYQRLGEPLSGGAGLNTLETNSGWVERRGRPLLEILARHRGLDSIAGLRVLDLGCGFGSLSVFFAAQGAVVTGIDPNAERLAVGWSVAEEHGLSAEFRAGRMQALDLPDRSFEIAVQNNSLCYITSRAERRAALRETWRVLRPGGVLIVRNPNRWTPLDPFTGLPGIHLLPPRQATSAAARRGKQRPAVRLTSPVSAAREMRKSGFAEIEQVASPSSSWPAFMKPIARYQHLVAVRPRRSRKRARRKVARSARRVKFQHQVVTRYAMKGLFYEEFSREWLEERLRVFRGYCVPGMSQQTAGDFSWLVLCDETTDGEYIDSLRESSRFVPQLRVVATSHERGIKIPQATAPFIDQDTNVLVTTRLDSDDSLNRETVAILQSYIEAFVESPYERWIVNFPRGYRYDEQDGRLYSTYWPYSPFSSLFEKLGRGRRRSSVYRNHHKLHLDLPVHFDESVPGWMQVIHGLAKSTKPGRRGTVVTAGNRDSTVQKDTDIEVALDQTWGSFGVDLGQRRGVNGRDDPEAGG